MVKGKRKLSAFFSAEFAIRLTSKPPNPLASHYTVGGFNLRLPSIPPFPCKGGGEMTPAAKQGRLEKGFCAWMGSQSVAVFCSSCIWHRWHKSGANILNVSVDAKVRQRCITFPGKKKPIFSPMFYGAYTHGQGGGIPPP